MKLVARLFGKRKKRPTPTNADGAGTIPSESRRQLHGGAISKLAKPTLSPALVRSVGLIVGFLDGIVQTDSLYQAAGDVRKTKSLQRKMASGNWDPWFTSLTVNDVHVAANALKGVLRAATPLVPWEQQCQMTADLESSDGAAMETCKRALSSDFPNKLLLQQLLSHLARVAECERTNVTDKILGDIFAPLLFNRSNDADAALLTHLIRHAVTLFPNSNLNSPQRLVKTGGYLMPEEGETLKGPDLTYIWELTHSFSADTEEYENILDRLTEASSPNLASEYDFYVTQLTDFRAVQRRRAHDIFVLLFKHPFDETHSTNIETLQTIFVKACSVYKTITMTFETIIGSADLETEFDAYVRPLPLGRDISSSVAAETPKKHREALNDLLYEEARIMRGETTGGRLPNKPMTGASQNTPRDRIRQKMAKKTSLRDARAQKEADLGLVYEAADSPTSVSWDPVIEQLIEARDRIVLQLERSRKQLGDKVPAYRIRDLHRSMAVPLSSELRQDGLVLLNEYNLDKLDAYRYPTKKTVIVNSLVFEPFLEFTPKSEAMRAYVRALEDIVYADREVANAVIFGTNVRPSP